VRDRPPVSGERVIDGGREWRLRRLPVFH
jgi:hypothetical protein